MEISTKKSVKMTTAMQFRQLVSCMEEYPHLATGAPKFGSSKAAMESTWDTVAAKLNAYGPPLRSGSEWKKVWVDLKGRLKKKLVDNNRSLKETGGGPSRISNLTELEVDIDRICHISFAAVPSGKVFGVPEKKPQLSQKLPEVTPPRGVKNVAIVTPTSISGKCKTFPQEFDNLPSTSNQSTKPYRMSTSTPKVAALPKRKRKHCEKDASEEQERLKLLRQQSESAIDVVAAVKKCTEAIKRQSQSLEAINSTLQLCTKSIVDILWHLEK